MTRIHLSNGSLKTFLSPPRFVWLTVYFLVTGFSRHVVFRDRNLYLTAVLEQFNTLTAR